MKPEVVAIGEVCPFLGGENMGEEKQKEPKVSFNLDYGRFIIHRTTLEVLGYPEFYRFLFNRHEKQLAIQSCGIDDAGSHQLKAIKDGDAYEVKSKDLLRLLYRSCNWDRFLSYRIQGTAYPEQRTVVFSLNEAQMLNEMRNSDETVE